MHRKILFLAVAALLTLASLFVGAGTANAAPYGPTCQSVSVGSGVVARGCISGDDSGCGAGTYGVSTWTMWNPTVAQGGATGTGSVSAIFYSTVEPGHYYSVPDGGTRGQQTPLYSICQNDSTTSKWEVQWTSTAGTKFTWCIYLVPGSGGSASGPC